MNRRRWLAVLLGAAAVALAVGGLYFALAVPMRSREVDGAADPAAERRAARPDLAGAPVEVPLVRMSGTHAGVRARAAVSSGDAGPERAEEALALLDTGATVTLTTPDGERLLGLEPGLGPSLRGHSLHRGALELLPVRESQRAVLSLVAPSDPRHVGARVLYLGVDRIEDAGFVVPPRALAPRGGAVTLDLAKRRLRSCESAAACAPGAGWVSVDGAPCEAFPELPVVAAELGRRPVRLLLDSGSSTVVSRRAVTVSDAGPPRGPQGREGELVMPGGQSLRVESTLGEWALALGRGPDRVHRKLAQAWVTDELGGVASACHLDGALGIDSLSGCEVTLVDGAPARILLRCAAPP